ncbi:MAG: hypothetical protein ACI4UX_02950 [Clostridia bacterium]
MNKSKKIIILISIIIVILIITIILLVSTKKKEKEEREIPKLVMTLDVKESKEPREFKNINYCVNDFFTALKLNESDKAFTLLDENYRSKNKINKSNVLEEVNVLNGKFDYFFAKKVNYKEISLAQQYQYYVYGEIYYDDYKQNSGIYVILNVDFVNNSYSIQFDDKNIKITEQEYDNIISKLKSNNTNEYIDATNLKFSEISANDYNSFPNSSTDKPDMLEEYLKNYSIMAVYDPEYAYNEMLDEEYRDAKFKNVEDYNHYTQNNKNSILNTAIKEYSVSEKEDYTEYFIIDTNNNYYTFKVKEVMNYTVIADFYTIELNQIAEKYDAGTEQEKVAINIQKVIAAIKDKDYKYVYNKLNENFKNNNYRTLEEFEQKMQNVYTGKMKLTFNDFSNEGSTYIYNINLKGTTASNNREVNMQIIMQLKENRDFVMSFSIK